VVGSRGEGWCSTLQMWFSDGSGSGNPDRRVNHPDVLRDGEELSRRLEQTEEHVMMMFSWLCKVSSEIHING
jgi:hypothetical protein